jgi:deoxyribose-phosphate aldolase
MESELNLDGFAERIDRSLLQPGLTRRQLELACAGARALGCHGVCVAGARVAEAAHWLEDSKVRIICAIGQPHGAADPDVKRYETETAIDSGAHRIELVPDAGRVKDGDDARVLRELRDVVQAADERPVSLVLQPAWLDEQEIRRLCALAAQGDAAGVTVDLNFGSAGPRREMLKRIRAALPEPLFLKAAGGVDNAAVAREWLDAGAVLLGVEAARGPQS